MLMLEVLLVICCFVCCITLAIREINCNTIFQNRTFMHEDIDLRCDMPTNCEHASWRRDNDNKVFVPGTCKDCGKNFFVKTNLSRGVNILQITNISDDDAGMYYCECHYTGYRNETGTDYPGCYNLTTYQSDCRVLAQVNGNTLAFDGSYNNDTKKRLYVSVGDNVLFTCANGDEIKKNCPDSDDEVALEVTQSLHRCKFICETSKDSVNCKIKVVINVLPSSTPNSKTLNISTTTTTSPPLVSHNLESSMSSSTVPVLSSSLDLFNYPNDGVEFPAYQWSTNYKEETDAISRTSTQNTILPSYTSVSDVHLYLTTNTSVTKSAVSLNTSSEPVSTVEYNITTPVLSTKQPQFVTHLFFVAMLSVIVVSVVIVVLLCIHMCRMQSYDDKEEWANPIYEGGDYRIQLRHVQSFSNQYEDVSSKPSGSSSTPITFSNDIYNENENQINHTDRPLNGTIVDRKQSLGSPMDTLGHGVASFSEDFIESSKNVGSQEDTLLTTNEANEQMLVLSDLAITSTNLTGNPGNGSISPHLYTTVNMCSN